jgi:hypothetical protein
MISSTGMQANEVKWLHEDKNKAINVRINGDFFNLTPFGNKREHDDEG